LGANIAVDLELLVVGGSLAAYATDDPEPRIPFWPLLFKNINITFLSSDNFLPAQKAQAAVAINEALDLGWAGMPIAEQFPLEKIATAHERLDTPRQRGRVVVIA
jgi:NADPH2:quinone reductase